MVLSFAMRLVLLMLFLVVTSQQSDISDVMTHNKDDVAQYMEDRLNEYKLELHKASQRKRSRAKREVRIEDFLDNSETIEAFESQIFNITPWQSVPTMHPVELEPFQIHHNSEHKQYLAVVNYKNLQGQFQTTSGVYKMNQTTEKFEMLQAFSTSGGIDFEYADLQGEQSANEKYAIFLDHVGQNWYGGNTYEKWFQLQQFLPNQNIENPFQYRTKVRALGAKRVKVFSKNGMHYFVTANSFYEMGEQYHVKSTMHVKSPYGYELVQSFATQGAQDVEVVIIDGIRYIIFANHQDNTGKVDIYSVVYREIQGSSRRGSSGPFELYQKLKTHGAKDFEYFSFEGHHYLAVANEYTKIIAFDGLTGFYTTIKDYNIDSIVYWWTGTMWVEWQRIPTQGAVKWSFFTSDFGDPMLVVANTQSQAVIYTYDPLRGLFKPTDVQGIHPLPNDNTSIPDVRSVMAYKTNSSTYLAVANYNLSTRTGYNIFKLSFNKRPVLKLDPSVPEIISAILLKMKTELMEIKESLSQVLLHVTNNVLTKSTDQNVTGTMTFSNITVRNTFVTNNLLYSDDVNINPVFDAAQLAVQLRDMLLVQEERINRFEERLRDAVKVNEKVTILGHKTFLQNLSTSNLMLNKTTVKGLVSGVNLTDLQQRSWSKSRDQNLTANFTMQGDVFFNGNVTLTGELNGKSISSLLTTNTEQVITSEKTFTNNLTFTTDVNANNFTLNGINFSEDIVTRTGVQTITGVKNFTAVNVNFNDVYTDGLVGGINLTLLNDNKMTLTTDQTISSSLIFESGFTVGSDVTVTGLVDGVNLTALYDDVMGEGQEQRIPGDKTFYGVNILKSLAANDINGYNLDDAMTINTVQTVTEKMVFKSDSVNFEGNVITNSTFDGINLSTEAVTTSGNFSITGNIQISASTTTFNDDIIVNGLVDSVNLTEWETNAVLLNTETIITSKKIFNQARIVNGLYAEHVNNINMSTVKENLISITGNTTVNTKLLFEDLEVENNLHLVGKLNNFSIPDDFVTLNTEQDISGKFTFQNKTVFTTVQFDANLNGENFTAFYEDVVKHGAEETITGNVNITGDVYFKNINVSGYVNGLSIPDDIVTLSTQQNITGKITFLENTTFYDDVNTFIVHVLGLVNGVDIYELERTAVRKDRNQTINGSIIFVGGIDCKQNLSVSGLINGVNLTELFNTTVRLSKDQTVSGVKTYNNDVMFDNTIQSPGLINNVNLTDLKENLMLKTKNQTISSGIIFTENLNVDNLILTSNISLINGINFHTFNRNAVIRGTNNTVNGDLTYLFNLEANFITAATVNNIDVTNNILLTNTNQNINSNIHFENINVQNLTISFINGLNLTDMYINALRVNTTQDITGQYTFKTLNVNDLVNVSGLINGYDLSEYIDQTVDLTSEQIITDWKTFTNVTFDNVNFQGLLNSVNITLLAKDVLMKTGNQTVCLSKNFLDSVTVNGSITQALNIVASGLINDVDISILANTAVLLDQYQELLGNYDFTDGIEISDSLTVSLLNNYNLLTDFVTTNTNQTIFDTKTFQQLLTLQGNFNVNGTIDGVDVQELDSQRFTTTTTQNITGFKNFLSTIQTVDINFPNNATVNDIDISEELVLTVGDPLINGMKYFANVTVTYVATSTGIINGVNLPVLDQNAVRLNSNIVQEIRTDQIFTRNVTIVGNLTVNGFINGMTVGQPQNYSGNVSDVISKELDDLSQNAQLLCQETTKFVPVSVTEIVFNGIQKLDPFYLPANNLGEIHSVIISDTVFVSIARLPTSQTCGLAYILQCNTNMLCSLLQTIQTNALKLEFFKYNDLSNSLLVDHWNTSMNESYGNTQCKQIPEIYTFSTSQGIYIPYQTLNTPLLSSSDGPILNSSIITAKQIGTVYGKSRYSNKGRNGKNLDNESDEEGIIQVEYFDKGALKNHIVVCGTSDEVDVLYLNGTTIGAVEIKQSIKSFKNPYISSGYLPNGKAILSISSISPIYGYLKLFIEDDNGKFQFFQQLPIAASSVKFENIGDKSYLSFANPNKDLGLCIWQGASGYQNCRSLQCTDSNFVENVITSYGAYTLTVIRNYMMTFKSIFEGHQEQYGNDIC